ncbi:hypothetical protein MZTS_23920 [Methylorubrum zatmanii]|nr:hypothetical protein [Methylorubrum zatmanii]
MCLLSEAALYALIMRSDKPAAAPFQLWVTGEVLPAIRCPHRWTADLVALA